MSVILEPVAGVDYTRLPSKSDFDPCGDLDAAWAWKNFGGLALEQAYVKFCERPETYQEDFMFMGISAFEYYFPVLDAYLRNVRPQDDLDDYQAPILGAAIKAQFDWPGARISEALRTRIAPLCAFMLTGFGGLHLSTKNHRNDLRSWVELQARLDEPVTPVN